MSVSRTSTDGPPSSQVMQHNPDVPHVSRSSRLGRNVALVNSTCIGPVSTASTVVTAAAAVFCPLFTPQFSIPVIVTCGTISFGSHLADACGFWRIWPQYDQEQRIRMVEETAADQRDTAIELDTLHEKREDIAGKTTEQTERFFGFFNRMSKIFQTLGEDVAMQSQAVHALSQDASATSDSAQRAADELKRLRTEIKGLLPKKDVARLTRKLSGLSLQVDEACTEQRDTSLHTQKTREFQQEFNKTVQRLDEFSRQLQQETACSAESGAAIRELQEKITALEGALHKATTQIESFSAFQGQFKQYSHLLQYFQNPRVVQLLREINGEQ